MRPWTAFVRSTTGDDEVRGGAGWAEATARGTPRDGGHVRVGVLGDAHDLHERVERKLVPVAVAGAEHAAQHVVAETPSPAK
jgi:hypothetical protein